MQAGQVLIIGSTIIQTHPEKTYLTNEIKKGYRIVQSNGWFGTMMDNQKGNIRIAEVEGFFTETGSIYAHDIEAVEIDGQWYAIKHTEKQLALKRKVGGMF